MIRKQDNLSDDKTEHSVLRYLYYEKMRASSTSLRILGTNLVKEIKRMKLEVKASRLQSRAKVHLNELPKWTAKLISMGFESGQKHVNRAWLTGDVLDL